jgi:hypothetical protein
VLDFVADILQFGLDNFYIGKKSQNLKEVT